MLGLNKRPDFARASSCLGPASQAAQELFTAMLAYIQQLEARQSRTPRTALGLLLTLQAPNVP